MNILVTGGGGYIGSTLVPMLLNDGHNVTVIDRFFFGENLLPDTKNLTKIKADVRNYDYNILKGIDAVIDLVAISNDPSGELLPKETEEINFRSRLATATKAKEFGVKRYILPSSCSIYGFQDNEVNERSEVNPLTIYAKNNYCAENEIIKLADDSYTVTILRQATIYGYSPRMRFDLAVNGMTFGAWKSRNIPLMRDGEQWRPMLHVQDAARAMMFMLKQNPSDINAQIFNVGSQNNSNYKIKDIAQKVVDTVPDKVVIEWYGDPDNRSYKVNFDKISKLGFRCEHTIEDGIKEIYLKLQEGTLDKTDRTITLKWYQNLIEWNNLLKDVVIEGKIF